MSAEAWAALRDEARTCRRCPLWEIGTQTVFGDGQLAPTVFFLGEAPGQQEDRTGRPFVGPAGQLFDDALTAAGIDRGVAYVTNTVKHRPWIQQPGGRGKNRPPKASEVSACRIWLDGELRLVQPRIVVCLGAVAARAMLGKDFKLMDGRGQWYEAEGRQVLPTVHPSFVLIQPADTHERWRQTFIEDLRHVAERLAAR